MRDDKKIFLVKETGFHKTEKDLKGFQKVELTPEELLFIKRCLEDCESEFAKNLLKKLDDLNGR